MYNIIYLYEEGHRFCNFINIIILCGMISAFHADAPGSIPGDVDFFCCVLQSMRSRGLTRIFVYTFSLQVHESMEVV